jgi:hypothetical protein
MSGVIHIIDDTTLPGFARPAKVSDFAGGGGGGGGGGGNGLTDDQLRASPVPVTDTAAAGTRAYNFDQATRTAVGATSSAAVAIGTLSASREVMLITSTRCFIRFGASTVTAANATDAALLVLPADAMFHMRLPSGVTHYTVIRDTADGFVRFVPVL